MTRETDPYAHVRAAFRDVTLGLMAWQSPPGLTPRQYRQLEGIPAPRIVYRPFDPQGDVEPYDVESDWRERA